MKWLHDIWSADRIAAFQPITLETKGRDAIRDRWSEVAPEHQGFMADLLVAGRLKTLCLPAFVVPVLSEEACAYLVQKSERYSWEENEQELPRFRIPEVVLREQDPQLEQELKVALFAALAPVTASIWGRLPDSYSSLQLTRYNPRGRDGGAYHIDATSDYTAVIALNDDFTGGGTTIVDGLLGETTIPPVPKGFALIFDGKKTLHKGLAVTSGDRLLLTVWAQNDKNKVW
jgi:predicted 2-oxoglutarate/Fe(II)-dependent dioxygenase YbiX